MHSLQNICLNTIQHYPYFEQQLKAYPYYAQLYAAYLKSKALCVFQGNPSPPVVELLVYARNFNAWMMLDKVLGQKYLL